MEQLRGGEVSDVPLEINRYGKIRVNPLCPKRVSCVMFRTCRRLLEQIDYVGAVGPRETNTQNTRVITPYPNPSQHYLPSPRYVIALPVGVFFNKSMMLELSGHE